MKQRSKHIITMILCSIQMITMDGRINQIPLLAIENNNQSRQDPAEQDVVEQDIVEQDPTDDVHNNLNPFDVHNDLNPLLENFLAIHNNMVINQLNHKSSSLKNEFRRSVIGYILLISCITCNNRHTIQHFISSPLRRQYMPHSLLSWITKQKYQPFSYKLDILIGTWLAITATLDVQILILRLINAEVQC